MGKSSISMAIFNSYVSLPEGIVIVVIGTFSVFVAVYNLSYDSQLVRKSPIRGLSLGCHWLIPMFTTWWLIPLLVSGL